MQTLYQLLDQKKKRRTSFEKSEEYSFFLKYRYILDRLPKFAFLYNSDHNDFDMMRANIIIRSYLNKNVFEKEIQSLEAYQKKNAEVDNELFTKTIRDKTLELPYYQDGKNRVFIAFFTKALNNIYINEPVKFLFEPYNKIRSSFTESIIDPFDTYGYQLYNSSFTRLIMVKENDNHKEAAFFHFDTDTIYFVNNQGRLDAKLVLFDKYIRHPQKTHLLERISDVVDAYFNFDRGRMIELLRNNKFISGKLMSILRKTTGPDDEI